MIKDTLHIFEIVNWSYKRLSDPKVLLYDLLLEPSEKDSQKFEN
jgi:hypothetical protein